VVEDAGARRRQSRRIAAAASATVAIFGLALGGWWVSSLPADHAAPGPARPAPHAAPATTTSLEVAFDWPAAPTFAADDLPQALSHYQRLAAERARDGHVHTVLGDILVALGRVSDAIASYQAATDNDPGNADLRVRLARLQCASRQWDACISSLRQALRAAADDPAIAYNLAVALQRKGADASALSEFARARTRRLDTSEVSLGEAISYDRLGRAAEALAAYDDYLRRAAGPRMPVVESRMAQLRQGATD
jgi:Flp pilus assembly protein TadD